MLLNSTGNVPTEGNGGEGTGQPTGTQVVQVPPVVAPVAPPSAPPATLTRRQMILADLAQTPTAEVDPTQTSTPTASGSTSTDPPEEQIPPAEEDPTKAFFRHEDYLAKMREVDALKAQLEADRVAFALGQPIPQEQRNPETQAPTTPPSAEPEFDYSLIRPEDFEDASAILLAQAVQQLAKQNADLAKRLDEKVSPLEGRLEEVHQAHATQVARHAASVMTAGAKTISDTYGIEITPEQAGQLAQKYLPILRAEFTELVPDLIVRAWRLENADLLIMQANSQVSQAQAKAVAEEGHKPRLQPPPDLTPRGLNSMPTENKHLSRRELIRRDLMGAS